MIQIGKMTRDAAGALWDVPPMAVSLSAARRGSGYVAMATYAGRSVEARGKTLEAAQQALVARIQRKLAKRMIRQMRVLSQHAGQRLPHRFGELPLPFSEMQFELMWSKLRKYKARVKPVPAREQIAA